MECIQYAIRMYMYMYMWNVYTACNQNVDKVQELDHVSWNDSLTQVWNLVVTRKGPLDKVVPDIRGPWLSWRSAPPLQLSPAADPRLRVELASNDLLSPQLRQFCVRVLKNRILYIQHWRLFLIWERMVNYWALLSSTVAWVAWVADRLVLTSSGRFWMW